MLNNEKLASLLIEAAELLDDETQSINNNETLTEASELVAVFGLLAAYVAILTLPIIAVNALERRAAAKSAKAISKEELADAVKFFNTISERVRTLFKQSSYKKYVEDGIITIHDKYTDFSDREEIKHIAFSLTYPIVSIDMVKLLKAYGKYDETIATDDRLNDWFKSESEKLAKLLDKIRAIFHQNKFVKENFSLILSHNENKSHYQMLLVAKQNLIFDSSKYIKNKKK